MRVVAHQGDRLKMGRYHYAMIYACVELSSGSGILSDEAIDSMIHGEKSFWVSVQESVMQRFDEDPSKFPPQVLSKSKSISLVRYFKTPLFLRDIKAAVEARLKLLVAENSSELDDSSMEPFVAGDPL